MFTGTFLSVLSFAILVVAMPNAEISPKTIVTYTVQGSQPTCGTSSLQCCQQVKKASDPTAAKLLNSLGVAASPDVDVGIACSAITVVGVGSGEECSAHTVCCQDNSYDGVVSIGCVPAML